MSKDTDQMDPLELREHDERMADLGEDAIALVREIVAALDSTACRSEAEHQRRFFAATTKANTWGRAREIVKEIDQ